MSVAVTVYDLALKKPWDAGFDQYQVLSCGVTFSRDGNAWMTAAENLVAFYPDGITSIAWPHHPISSHYWRTYPLTWVDHPSMRANLIGR